MSPASASPLGSPFGSGSQQRSSFAGRHRATSSADSQRPLNRVKFDAAVVPEEDDEGGDARSPRTTSPPPPPASPTSPSNQFPRRPTVARTLPHLVIDYAPPIDRPFSPSPPTTTASPLDDDDDNDSQSRLMRSSTPMAAGPPSVISSPEQEKEGALHSAHERAKRLASIMRRPSSMRPNGQPWFSRFRSHNTRGSRDRDIDPEKGGFDNDDYADEIAHLESEGLQDHGLRPQISRTAEARALVNRLRSGRIPNLGSSLSPGGDDIDEHPAVLSGTVTPTADRDPDNYVAPPQHYRDGILTNLLKLYESQQAGDGESGRETPQTPRSPRARSPTRPKRSWSPGWLTPQYLTTKPRWYTHSASPSTTSLNGALSPGRPASPTRDDRTDPDGRPASAAAGEPSSAGPPRRPPMPRSKSSGMLSNAARKITSSAPANAARNKMTPRRPRLEDEIRITVHIAEVLARQRYMLKLCRALMQFGAPTHRLEEYMRMTARVLEIEGQFLYIPGCMVVAFDDSATHTTEVKLVKTRPGVSGPTIDLGRLADTHEIYKEVVHDVIGVDEAMQRLDEVFAKGQRWNAWWLILFYGCASATVGPFAFHARLIDVPISFFLGCLLGLLQHVICPRSDLYSNVFEISAAVLTSFLSRAFGSIRLHDGSRLFCFSALAQSSIALILPGYIVLCGSLELQSRSLVAGSVRMVYAVIYSLFLGFGILIGTALYGVMDGDATSEYQCANPDMNIYVAQFPFVFVYTFFLIIINQGKWRQVPIMMFISFAGYVVDFFSSLRFTSNTQISNALGAFTIGVLGNLYSRFMHGLAAAAILPAIFVQVPSGLASSGSILSGITIADDITRNHSHGAPTNGGNASQFASQSGSSRAYGNVVFDIGYAMVQVAIGITVGLFLATLVVYPFGKRRSGLFTM